jgi:hypothetical protein
MWGQGGVYKPQTSISTALHHLPSTLLAVQQEVFLFADVRDDAKRNELPCFGIASMRKGRLASFSRMYKTLGIESRRLTTKKLC